MEMSEKDLSPGIRSFLESRKTHLEKAEKIVVDDISTSQRVMFESFTDNLHRSYYAYAKSVGRQRAHNVIRSDVYRRIHNNTSCARSPDESRDLKKIIREGHQPRSWKFAMEFERMRTQCMLKNLDEMKKHGKSKEGTQQIQRYVKPHPIYDTILVEEEDVDGGKLCDGTSSTNVKKDDLRGSAQTGEEIIISKKALSQSDIKECREISGFGDYGMAKTARRRVSVPSPLHPREDRRTRTVLSKSSSFKPKNFSASENLPDLGGDKKILKVSDENATYQNNAEGGGRTRERLPPLERSSWKRLEIFPAGEPRKQMTEEERQEKYFRPRMETFFQQIKSLKTGEHVVELEYAVPRVPRNR